MAVLAPGLYHAPAASADAPQPVAYSVYISSTVATDFYNWGSQLGQAVANLPGTQRVTAVLQFGKPVSLGGGQYGAHLYNNTNQNGTTIRTLSEQFAVGFYNGAGSDVTSQLYLGIGTNNDGSAVGTASGTMWSNMVKNANADAGNNPWGSQVNIHGANDIEPVDSNNNWNTAAVTRPWINAYDGVSGAIDYYDNGAAFCQTSGTLVAGSNCGIGWTAEDIWFASWGAARARPAPQIYHTNSDDAKRWSLIAVYSVSAHGQSMVFWSSVTQYKACTQTAGCPGNGTDNTPDMGYNQLTTQLSHQGVNNTLQTDTDFRK
jgi:hypothetical protein